MNKSIIYNQLINELSKRGFRYSYVPNCGGSPYQPDEKGEYIQMNIDDLKDIFKDINDELTMFMNVLYKK